ncbi:hypothetical protein R1flu_021834 [Riccia fluitans]|uniref:Ricin B lectin domain-containing protein n=1 Tax=Riccia fluitans TaxID=41844 RepID=A0ABD1ZSD9_9MARC
MPPRREVVKGIPLPHTPFKLIDGEYGRSISLADEDTKKPVLSRKDRNTIGSFFQLVASPMFDGCYHILSIENGLALADEGKDGHLVMEPLAEKEELQVWEIIASKTFEDGNYMIQNQQTRCFLVSCPFEEESSVYTFPDEQEIKRHMWSFSFTEGDFQGIPPTQTLFTYMNLGTGRYLCGDSLSGHVYLRGKRCERKYLHFRLVAPRARVEWYPSAYLVESVYTSKFLSASSPTEDELAAVKLDTLNEDDLNQFWIILPSRYSEGTYRLRNCGTKGVLLNGTTSMATVFTDLVSSKRNPYQDWIFCLV